MNDFFTTLTASGPLYTILFILAALTVILVVARNIIARWIIALSKRTETKVDDTLVKHIKPMRTAWLAPLIALYLIAEQVPDYQQHIEIGALFGILWLGTRS